MPTLTREPSIGWRTVPAGAVGSRILVTNLANHVQPFIRYEIGDRLSLAKTPCECGSKLPRIDAIEGRDADVFWFEQDGRRRFIAGVVLHSAADALSVVREWQARQIDERYVELRLDIDPAATLTWPEIEGRMRELLRRYDWPDSVQLSIVRSERLLPDPRTGKMRRMTPLPSARDVLSAGEHRFAPRR